jgi:acetyltransferase-like isoleucine patch superfamily enzyme
MFMRHLKGLIRFVALRTGRWGHLYRRFCVTSSFDWTEYLRRWGGLHAVGESVAINIGCNITDPYLVSIGNNVTLASCTLLGHEGVIRVVNNARHLKLDSVGIIDIRDNCFIGHGSIVMPNVRIGPDSIVAAGAVVTKDVPPGMVVGGCPAKVIGTFDDMVERLTTRSERYPWFHLIEKREGAFDPAMEPELRALRKAYFFGAVGRKSTNRLSPRVLAADSGFAPL